MCHLYYSLPMLYFDKFLVGRNVKLLLPTHSENPTWFKWHTQGYQPPGGQKWGGGGELRKNERNMGKLMEKIFLSCPPRRQSLATLLLDVHLYSLSDFKLAVTSARILLEAKSKLARTVTTQSLDSKGVVTIVNWQQHRSTV